jgi:hypothetical protein
VTPYTIAWLVAAGAAVLGTAMLVVLTRKIGSDGLRRALRWLPPLLLLVPVGVPGYEGHYAPAFVVAIFEFLFQTDGRPMAATRVLLLALAMGLIGILLAGRYFGSRKPDADADQDPAARNN